MFKPKKSLGQNFLKSKKALNKIIEAGEIKPGDFVLEIGPGKGALTKILLENRARVLAIEKDNRAVEFLKEELGAQIAAGDLRLLEADILEFNPEEIEGDYKLIANIPYYITGEIIEKFLSSSKQPKQIVVLVQKEVAERIVSRDKKESILSNSVKIFGEPKYTETVNKKMFSPSPKVDSAILSIKNISKNKLIENNISEEKFFDVLKTGFKHKRKRVLKNLSEKFDISKIEIDKNIRPEELKTEDWLNISKNIS